MSNATPFSEAYPAYVKQWHVSNVLSPDTTAASSNKKVLWLCDNNSQHEWEASPNGRFKANGKVLGCPYCTGRRVDAGVNDLATRFPDVALQWSHRNVLSPLEVHASSNKTFWWVGDCGHEWDAPVLGRTSQKDGCPYCSGHRVLKGFNDLSTHYPELAQEWDDERDVGTVSRGSSYVAKWRGASCGHTWEAAVIRRAKGEGCPYCSGHRVLKGFNDLASQRPDLSRMWDKSNSRRSDAVTLGSGYKATWVCSKGHRTQAPIIEKIAQVSPCPVCAGTVTVEGVTDFATKHPLLAEQWVRGVKHPSEVRSMSSAVATWRCAKGHEWDAPFSRRASGHGCPFCAGQRAVEGVNDLASRFPVLVKEWHPDNGIHPSHVAWSSSTPYKWVCDEGHVWVVSPNQRTSHKEGITGCPTCWSSGRSQAEHAMAGFIKSVYAGRVISHHKLGRLELDVYLPDEGIAFEFNGVHWHSEIRGRGKDTHKRKLDACAAKGIHLIQVWEDDWRDRRAVVERLIAHKLRVSGTVRIGARSTSVSALPASEARKFLDAHHIQGFTGGTYYDALVTKDGEVVAVAVTTHLKAGVRIDRYATSSVVQGGFSKLLKVISARAVTDGHPNVFTFSDNEISEGDLYRNTGFIPAGNLHPDYKYVYNATRVHKFMFRKARFRKDSSLKYDPSMTESELAALNGITRVWDSGKVRWELDLVPSGGNTLSTGGASGVA